MMQSFSFLNDSFQLINSSKQVICFKSSVYPLLFGRACASYCAQLFGLSFSYQRMQTNNQAAAMAALQTSFLGTSNCYWLGSLDELSPSKQKVWTEFFKSYHGPHRLIFFSSTFVSSKIGSIETIELPDKVDASLFQNIAQMLGAQTISFRVPLFKQTKKVSLDEAYLFVKYDAVLGKRSAQFARDWLPDMIVPEVSLFSLSQALFDRKPSSFFELWKQLAHRYTAPFWITFWSEQLWRAYCYVRFQKRGKQLEAKKIGYRLPFSFLNRTWRNYTLEELKAYHHFLYEIDYQVKNGGSAYALDLFYATILLQSG